MQRRFVSEVTILVTTAQFGRFNWPRARATVYRWLDSTSIRMLLDTTPETKVGQRDWAEVLELAVGSLQRDASTVSYSCQG